MTVASRPIRVDAPRAVVTYESTIAAQTAKNAPVSLGELDQGYFVTGTDPAGSIAYCRQVEIRNPQPSDGLSVWVGWETGAYREIPPGEAWSTVIERLNDVYVANPDEADDVVVEVSVWLSELPVQ